MPPLIPLVERSASRSPANFNIAIDSGVATVPLRLTDESQLEDAVLAVIGSVEPSGTGRLNRSIPLRHGRFRGWYAERITGADGVGTGESHNTRLPVNENGNSLDVFSKYDIYTLNAQFMSRPYSVLPDEDIIPASLTWSNSRTSTTTGIDSKEYHRFVEWDLIDDDTVLEADQGAFYYAGGDGPLQPRGTFPHGSEFVGKPKLFIKQSKLIATWYSLPHFFATHPNSYLRKYKNTVNQLSFLGYPAGTLLYKGYTVLRKWTPFHPADAEPSASLYVGGLPKICDLRLEWSLRDQVVVSGGPSNVGPGGGPPYYLYQSPHNSAPTFMDRLWWSIIMANPADINNKLYWTPLYDSFPHQLLFTDPSV